MTQLPFLRLPPFPRSRPASGPASWSVTVAELESLKRQLATTRVGGRFWGHQHPLAPGKDLLLAPTDAAEADRMLEAVRVEGRVDRAIVVGSTPGLPNVPDRFDPWHLVDGVEEIWAGAGHDLALVARLSGKPLRLFGSSAANGDPLRAAIERSAMVDPFTGAATTPAAVVDLLADWRRLIDANRTISAVFGVARWKRRTIDPLLWDGQGPVRHARSMRDAKASGGDLAIAWKTRTPATLLAALEARGTPGEIEDGMIRSIGLGANCVPPLSIIVDRRGIYFDPSVPSDLEVILAEADMSPELLARAAALRARIVREGISKYARGNAPAQTKRGSRRRVLVTGQVEDDRSIQTGGAGMTNLALLTAARSLEPDAWIIYKPHPDVEAGHRKGLIPETDVLRLANEIERHAPITTLIDSVDAVHVISSLAGFEALLRGKPVTTHGVPFYAGWGLTHDLVLAPPRRSRRLSIDQLVAGTLILYPRYVDPVRFFPCSPEVLIDRISNNLAKVSSPLIVIREMQGRLRKVFERLIRRRR